MALLETLGTAVVGLLFLGLAFLCSMGVRHTGGRVWNMLTTTTRSVDEIEPGEVEVQGTVVPAGETVPAEREDEEVVVRTEGKSYHDREPGGKQSSWAAFFNLISIPMKLSSSEPEEAVPFYLEDDTGKVLVDATTAQASLPYRGGGASQSNAATTVTHSQHLTAGDEVYALGTAVSVDDYVAEVEAKKEEPAKGAGADGGGREARSPRRASWASWRTSRRRRTRRSRPARSWRRRTRRSSSPPRGAGASWSWTAPSGEGGSASGWPPCGGRSSP